MTNKSSDAFDRRFGQAIIFYRRQAGLSRKKLGAELGVTHQQVAKYERGENRVSISRAIRMAQVLQVSLSLMIERAGSEANCTIDLAAARIMRNVRRIKNKNVKEQLVKLVAAIGDDLGESK